MAFIRSFRHKPAERNSLHDEIGATYKVFEHDGRVLIQKTATVAIVDKCRGKRARQSNWTKRVLALSSKS
jgi:hypothetical protein